MPRSDVHSPTQPRRQLVSYSGRFGWAIFGQASRDVGGPISGQHLGVIGLAGAVALLDLLGTAFFSRFPKLGSDSIRVDQLLSKGRFTTKQCSDKTQVAK
jgi:hypothetical protein